MHWLRTLVVCKLYVCPLELLSGVLQLLQLEHLLIELLLQLKCKVSLTRWHTTAIHYLLIGIVDAELLEAVHIEHLEPVDVKHAYRPHSALLQVIG